MEIRGAGLLAVKSGFILFIQDYQFCIGRPMDDIREDPSRAPSLVFFPMKPQPHYKGEGRVERNGTLVRRGSLDQHNLTWGDVGVVSVPLKATSSDCNRCPKKRIIIKRKVLLVSGRLRRRPFGAAEILFELLSSHQSSYRI